MRTFRVVFALSAVLFTAGSASLAQQLPGPRTLENLLPDKPAPETKTDTPESRPARPNGSCERPNDGCKHADLDKAWKNYDEAIEKVLKDLRQAMNDQRQASRNAGDLEAAKSYKAMLESLEKDGSFPAKHEKLQKQIIDAQKQLKSAAEQLGKAYDRVVDKMLKDPAIEESIPDKVKSEWEELAADIGKGKKLPRDTIKIGKHRYYFYTDPVTQAEAVAECQKLGGYLAQITERTELAMIQRKLLPLRREMHFWIDGTDSGHEGSWTLLNQTPFQGLLPWHRNQPDNGGYSRPTQNGLTIWLKRNYSDEWAVGMDDEPQESKHGFICEWD
jgi:DNA-binding ferritin-like protein